MFDLVYYNELAYMIRLNKKQNEEVQSMNENKSRYDKQFIKTYVDNYNEMSLLLEKHHSYMEWYIDQILTDKKYKQLQFRFEKTYERDPTLYSLNLPRDILRIS